MILIIHNLTSQRFAIKSTPIITIKELEVEDALHSSSKTETLQQDGSFQDTTHLDNLSNYLESTTYPDPRTEGDRGKSTLAMSIYLSEMKPWQDKEPDQEIKKEIL